MLTSWIYAFPNCNSYWIILLVYIIFSIKIIRKRFLDFTRLKLEKCLIKNIKFPKYIDSTSKIDKIKSTIERNKIQTDKICHMWKNIMFLSHKIKYDDLYYHRVSNFNLRNISPKIYKSGKKTRLMLCCYSINVVIFHFYVSFE